MAPQRPGRNHTPQERRAGRGRNGEISFSARPSPPRRAPAAGELPAFRGAAAPGSAPPRAHTRRRRCAGGRGGTGSFLLVPSRRGGHRETLNPYVRATAAPSLASTGAPVREHTYTRGGSCTGGGSVCVRAFRAAAGKGVIIIKRRAGSRGPACGLWIYGTAGGGADGKYFNEDEVIKLLCLSQWLERILRTTRVALRQGGEVIFRFGGRSVFGF